MKQKTRKTPAGYRGFAKVGQLYLIELVEI